MKNSVLLMLLVFLTLGGNMTAQQRGLEANRDKGEMLDKMKEKLSLTDQQVSQIKAIDSKYSNQEQDFRNKMTKLREEHQALRDQKKSEIDKILSTEQRQKITEWRKEGRRGGNEEFRNKNLKRQENKKKGKGIRR